MFSVIFMGIFLPNCPIAASSLEFRFVWFFNFFKLIYFTWRLITLQYCIGFAIHWHESTMVWNSVKEHSQGIIADYNLSPSATLKHSYITTVSISFIALNFSHLIRFIFVFITPVLTPQPPRAPPRVKCRKAELIVCFLLYVPQTPRMISGTE